MTTAKISPIDSRAADEPENTQLQPVLVSIAPRVLLVDDDEIMTERLRDLVAGAAYDVTTVTSGAAALAELERQFAPILILDRNMPGMDGLTLCRKIREGAHYPGYVYIMLCTAHDSEEEILAGLDAGADDYISKRASGAQLVARLAVARRILTLEHSLKLVIEERRRMAMTDSLTGAHNRRYFMSHMSRELKRVRRTGGELALLVLDIDHFKQINDRFGHAAGDAVLSEFVRRVQGMLPREYDWCARLGGEEFAVVLPQTDFAGAALVAEKIRVGVAASPVDTEYGAVPVAISGGVSGLAAFVDRSAVTVEQLLRRADDCLYDSKHAGRNRVTVDQAAPRPRMGETAIAKSAMAPRLAELARKFLARCADDVVLMHEALERFAAGEPQALGDMQNLAHRMNGTGATLGFEVLGASAARLEIFLYSLPAAVPPQTTSVASIRAQLDALAAELARNTFRSSNP